SEFVPQTDQGFISLRLNTPLGSSLEYTDEKTRQVEEALREFPEIASMDVEVGTREGKNYARINMPLVKRSEGRTRSQKELEDAIRKRLSRIAGIELQVGWNRPIFISILGPDYATLNEISRDLMQEMEKIPGIADLESSEKGENPTISIRIN